MWNSLLAGVSGQTRGTVDELEAENASLKERVAELEQKCGRCGSRLMEYFVFDSMNFLH